MSIVIVQGNGFVGKFCFENAEKAFEFYYEQCKNDRYVLIHHNEEPYSSDWINK